MGLEAVSSASESCCPTHYAKGTLGISEKCQRNHENIWPNGDSSPDLLLENFFSSLNCRDHLFENINCGQKYIIKYAAENEKKNYPTE